jgi:hypothetical protein
MATETRGPDWLAKYIIANIITGTGGFFLGALFLDSCFGQVPSVPGQKSQCHLVGKSSVDLSPSSLSRCLLH